MKTHQQPPPRLHWEQVVLLLIFSLTSGRLWALSGWHVPPTAWQELGAMLPHLSHLWMQQGPHLLPPLLLLLLAAGELPGALLFLFLSVWMLACIISLLTSGFKSARSRQENTGSNNQPQLAMATRTLTANGDGSEPAMRTMLASNNLHGSNLCGIFAILDGRASRSNAGQAVSLLIGPIGELLQEVIANPRQKTLKSLLFQRLQQANACVFEYNHTHHEALRGTATILVVLERVAYIGHIGTNRIYLSREHEGLYQITTDHGSPSMHSEERGELQQSGPQEPARLMGEMARVLCDILTIPLRKKDLLLLCSEEIEIAMPETAIEQILHAYTQETLIAEALLHAVQEKSEPQTTASVIVVRLASYETTRKERS